MPNIYSTLPQHANHIPSINKYSPSACQPYTQHIQYSTSACQPYTQHKQVLSLSMLTIYPAYTSTLPQHANHIPSIYQYSSSACHPSLQPLVTYILTYYHNVMFCSLTHPITILVNNQFDAQFFFLYLFIPILYMF